jgi:hypothetical protein
MSSPRQDHRSARFPVVAVAAYPPGLSKVVNGVLGLLARLWVGCQSRGEGVKVGERWKCSRMTWIARGTAVFPPRKKEGQMVEFGECGQVPGFGVVGSSNLKPLYVESTG